jgi:hypothetical protein
MTGVRVRWTVLGRVAAIAVAGLAAVQVLPGLLRAPEPPPLAADVGLPRPQAVARFHRHEPRAKGTADRTVRPRPVRTAPRRSGPAGSAVISSFPRRHKANPRPSKPAPEPVAAAPVQPSAVALPTAPAAAAETQPTATPEAPIAPPEPPNDGSVEFAPH